MKWFKAKPEPEPVHTDPWHPKNNEDPFNQLLPGRYFIYNQSDFKVLERDETNRCVECINVNNVAWKEEENPAGSIILVVPVDAPVFPRKQCPETLDGHRCLWYSGHQGQHLDDTLTWYVAKP